MIYLTFNDQPSGVYQSQVIDTILFLRSKTKEKVWLVAFISLRRFGTNRRLIKNKIDYSIVIPMFPGVGNWKWNIPCLLFLKLFLKGKIMARGVFATYMAVRAKKLTGCKVIFDARGAYKAEFTEYDVVKDQKTIKRIEFLEHYCLVNSDFRLSVSRKLIEYWKREFNYKEGNEVVVPCTLNSLRRPLADSSNKIHKRSQNETWLVYAGSSAGWQSFSLMDKLLTDLFEKQPQVKLLLLANNVSGNFNLLKQFPDRVVIKWLQPAEVESYISSCDYGLLIRENSVTNKVSSPTKFAEYLSAGLRVIISPEIGDFSEFVQQNNCGIIVTDHITDQLLPTGSEEKMRLSELAEHSFTKDSFSNEYITLINL